MPLKATQMVFKHIEAPRSDSTALGHEQIGLELTAERLGPNGARRSQATGNALAFAVQTHSCEGVFLNLCLSMGGAKRRERLWP